MAQPVADYVGLFDEVLASNGKTNLRGKNKLRALTEKFGERGFDYAGNSSADFAVWRGARQAVVVNASRRVRREAARCTQLGRDVLRRFFRRGRRLELLHGIFLAQRLSCGHCRGTAAGAARFQNSALRVLRGSRRRCMLAAAHGKSGGDCFRVGYVSGLAFWLASLYWLLLMPVSGFPILGWLALSAFVALFYGAWVWLDFKFQISNFKFWILDRSHALDARRRGGMGRAGNVPRRAFSADFLGAFSASRNISLFRSSRSRRSPAFMAYRFWSCGFRSHCIRRR